ncbi:hypothetical protein L7F22_053719 [Adiantum nelumboides]|nr:hypothetical protein [Adiantum nelumboides]
MLNNTGASNLPDSNNTARSFTSSFSAQSGASPVFHPTGSIPGLHNVHGSYNMPTMPSSMSSRNPVGAVHQPSGSLQTGRFAANNLPTSLTQISHGGLPGHSGLGSRTVLSSGGSGTFNGSLNGTVTSVSGASPNSAAVNNRTTAPGLGVSPSMVGGPGPRITNTASSMISGAVGGGLGRTMNSGAGMSIPSFGGSRLGSNMSGLGMQGPGRPARSTVCAFQDSMGQLRTDPNEVMEVGTSYYEALFMADTMTYAVQEARAEEMQDAVHGLDGVSYPRDVCLTRQFFLQYWDLISQPLQ